MSKSTGVSVKSLAEQRLEEGNGSGQQHLVINAIEFDVKHKNYYGYLALASFILVLINHLMIGNRACQFSFANGGNNFDLIQQFHMIVLIISIIVFILSYFNFAVIIYDFKLLFYTTVVALFICVGLLVYNVITIIYAPCVSMGNQGFLAAVDASVILNGSGSIFTANDGVGITVFFFDIFAAVLLFMAGRSFYKRS